MAQQVIPIKAKEPDVEQHGEVASLFRAASRAEQVHAANHSEVIRKLGAQPVAKLDQAVVKITRENLQAAIYSKTYQRDTMYQKFQKQARLNGNRDALKSLNVAKAADAEHAELYSGALSNRDHLKGSKSVMSFVCPTCGFTIRDTNLTRCPSCFTSKEKFEVIV